MNRQKSRGKSIFRFSTLGPYSLQEKIRFVVLLRNCIVPGHTQSYRRPRQSHLYSRDPTQSRGIV